MHALAQALPSRPCWQQGYTCILCMQHHTSCQSKPQHCVTVESALQAHRPHACRLEVGRAQELWLHLAGGTVQHREEGLYSQPQPAAAAERADAARCRAWPRSAGRPGPWQRRPALPAGPRHPAQPAAARGSARASPPAGLPHTVQGAQCQECRTIKHDVLFASCGEWLTAQQPPSMIHQHADMQTRRPLDAWSRHDACLIMLHVSDGIAQSSTWGELHTLQAREGAAVALDALRIRADVAPGLQALLRAAQRHAAHALPLRPSRPLPAQMCDNTVSSEPAGKQDGCMPSLCAPGGVVTSELAT